MKEKLHRAEGRKISRYFPETGRLARQNYPCHMAFFKAGIQHRERCFMAANRVGKTESAGGYEMTLHLTGNYPDWWEGRRFTRPIKAWAAGDTNETVRDILQAKLLGAPGLYGTGLIPRNALARWTIRAGLRDAVLDIYVNHANGGLSQLTLKSYEQGRKKFQGTEIDVVWLDEEPPMDIYGECLVRTMTTGGIVMLTFTPLMGLSDVVRRFLEPEEDPSISGQSIANSVTDIEGIADTITGTVTGTVTANEEIGDTQSLCYQNTSRPPVRCLIQAGWQDVPHLSKADKVELQQGLPPHEVEARTTGKPTLGRGAVYPVSEETIQITPFELPPHWPRVFAMDVGWQRTAVIWAAWDRDSDCLYLYSEHYQGQAEPVLHAAAIRARGAWIPGVIDPAAQGRAQSDGLQLIKAYRDFGLNIKPADNAVEAGIFTLWQRLSTGRLKVFSSLKNWLDEFRLYHRDENGKIVKTRDHLMDATRYLVMSGVKRAITRPKEQAKPANMGLRNRPVGY